MHVVVDSPQYVSRYLERKTINQENIQKNRAGAVFELFKEQMEYN